MSKKYVLIGDDAYKNMVFKSTKNDDDFVTYSENRLEQVLNDPSLNSSQKNQLLNQILSGMLKTKRHAEEKPINVRIVDDKTGISQDGLYVNDKITGAPEFTTSADVIETSSLTVPSIAPSPIGTPVLKAPATLPPYETILEDIKANPELYGIVEGRKIRKNFRSNRAFKGSDYTSSLDYIYTKRGFKKAPDGTSALRNRIKERFKLTGTGKKKMNSVKKKPPKRLSKGAKKSIKIIKFKPSLW